ncbi:MULTISPECIES: pentapeptide repeat-containing protein [unclassified Tychonema]|uniref:pentapeptide repeat-containing protein n=1 Tax=unclassified Tychonema TaxID=2642144 RepID=UPI00187EEF79|nr:MULTISPECIES: pentapeptide repeat-containing protein [unclassified Tychonema]MBE9131914.1 pentapeptide repeat-containing protein [Tychonema sp. LEGE 07196]MBE9162568.1 pentapeptide repeat-containing protein [Tychonema sp. LEGE 06208]
MTVDEAITIAETALNYDRLNKVQEIVFRQSWEGQSYIEIAKTAGYEYDYIKDAGAKLWKLLSKALDEKVKKDNLKSVLKRYLRRSQVNLQRNLTIEVNLSGANLSGANLSGARLFANLNEADYVQADLDKITSNNETELSNSNKEIDWNGFCFHCDAQVKIAEILDRTSTLFIPNSQLRLATPEGRQNQEADFLIFHQNKLGMLKIDSESSDRNATEDEMCGLLIDSGISLIKHYDSTRCSQQPDLVVQEFLEILSQK